MGPTPNADEAAAIAAAIQQFVAETSVPADDGQGDGPSPWRRAALVEGVGAKASIENLQGEGGAKWLS